MVSVIVLTYNHEKYIRQALDSILMQEVDFSYEVLIGDDCSTDRTPEILKEYANKYPEIFSLTLRPCNLGASKNLYELLNLAKGKYIAHLEGDDYWTDSKKLQLQVALLEQDDLFIACTHKHRIVDENGVEHTDKKVKWVAEKEVFTLNDFGGIKLPGQAASLVYRNIFLKPKYDYSIIYKANRMISDRTLVLLLAAQGNIYQMDRVMSHYRYIMNENNQNVTSQIYLKNDESKYIDYKLTCVLEDYAKNVLKKSVNFNKFKAKLFLKSLLKFALRPSTDRLVVIKKITEEWK